jgi:hypothetical protein
MPLVTTPPDIDPAVTEGRYALREADHQDDVPQHHPDDGRPSPTDGPLRRLACEFLPLNDPASTSYDSSKPANPYITVDYVENVPWRDRVEYDSAAGTTKRSPRPWALDHLNKPAVGRVQPYAAHSTQRARSAGRRGDRRTKILHTFFRHNSTENMPRRNGDEARLDRSEPADPTVGTLKTRSTGCCT